VLCFHFSCIEQSLLHVKGRLYVSDALVVQLFEEIEADYAYNTLIGVYSFH